MGLFKQKSQDLIKTYQNETPKLDLETFLQGKISGCGIIQNRSGKVTSRFDFAATGSLKKDVLTLDEHMVYTNGKKDHRIWTIQKVAENSYIGTTHDVVGEAKIEVCGNAMNWQYQMDVEVKGKKYRITFDDWMFLMNDGSLLNVNRFSKFGLSVGSLTLVMNKG